MIEEVLSVRPSPGSPRPYQFPSFERSTLPGGLDLITVDIPGRPLVSADLVLRAAAADEPPAEAGSAVLATRALSEGTERYDAIALIEAAERLGAALHADAGWDATTASVEVPAERLEPALELLAEMVRRPTFPAAEVERLRDERLNDLLQARADPRRRADEAFIETVYTPASPYHRPAGGTADTVAGLVPEVLRRAHGRALASGRAVLIVGGALAGIDVRGFAERLLDGLDADAAGPAARPASQPPVVESAVAAPLVRVIDRPGSVQTEIRVGHVGLPRRIPDFHAVQLMTTILGGLFNSRLNMKLREEKGYTYGAGAGFDMRRAAGPFIARSAVNAEVTVPAIAGLLAELHRMRDEEVTRAELGAARDYLVGVFPLRFETPDAVVGALAGLAVHDLPDDELARYRGAIEAVSVDDVRKAARNHIDLERIAVVLVGDASRFASELRAADFGGVEVVEEELPVGTAGGAATPPGDGPG